METKKDTLEMTPTFLTLNGAEGSIEPGPEQQERLNEITLRLQSGEFHKNAEGLIPVICIDGRPNGFHLLPNAAGGTETLFVADDLINRTYATEDSSTVGGYANIISRVLSKGGQVGGHDDQHHGPEGSGCGANDKLPLIYEFLSQKGDTIRETAGALNIKVSDELHDKIIGNAKNRTAFSSGAEMLSTLEQQDDAVIERLTGEHKEVIAVINTKQGTTLDRKALADEFGENYEAFNVDVWAFEEAARMLSNDETEIAELVTAMAYYNLATTFVLVGKGLRVIVR